jgi:alpha,alpha-trehalase
MTPNWLPLAVAVDDGDWLTPRTAEVLDQSQSRDLRRGILTRRFRLRDGAGRIVGGIERRFVLADKHSAGQDLTVTPENWSGRLRVRSGIDGSVQSKGLDLHQRLPRNRRDLVQPITDDDGVSLMVVETPDSRLRLVVATHTVVTHNDLPWHDGWAPIVQPMAAYQETTVLVSAGDLVQARKTAARYDSADPQGPEPLAAALADMTHSFAELLERHLLTRPGRSSRLAVREI